MPLAGFEDLATLADLVVVFPEPVDGHVVDDTSVLGPVGPDVPADVADAHDADGSLLGWFGPVVLRLSRLLRHRKFSFGSKAHAISRAPSAGGSSWSLPCGSSVASEGFSPSSRSIGMNA